MVFGCSSGSSTPTVDFVDGALAVLEGEGDGAGLGAVFALAEGSVMLAGGPPYTAASLRAFGCSVQATAVDATSNAAATLEAAPRGLRSADAQNGHFASRSNTCRRQPGQVDNLDMYWFLARAGTRCIRSLLVRRAGGMVLGSEGRERLITTRALLRLERNRRRAVHGTLGAAGERGLDGSRTRAAPARRWRSAHGGDRGHHRGGAIEDDLHRRGSRVGRCAGG